MGTRTLPLGKAWSVYDRWLEDPRVEFYPEPRNLDAAFRSATSSLATRNASNAIGDCFLMACAGELHATLVTFDRALHTLARKQGHAAVIPV